MRLVIAGAGVVGAELALHAARSGHEVVLHDRSDEALSRARAAIGTKQRFARLLGGGPTVADQAIRFMPDPPFAEVEGWLIEAITEDPEAKAEVIAEASARVASGAIIASTTSAIPIGWLADRGDRPDRMVGLHFMTPVSMSRAVEVIRGPATSDDTIARALGLLHSLDRLAVVVSDGPGFVGNRVLMLAINEAIGALADGVADAATVDRVFVECFGHPMGPLALADLIGLDTIANTLHVLRRFAGGDRFLPQSRLTALVADGALGQKSGRGFYDYRAID